MQAPGQLYEFVIVAWIDGDYLADLAVATEYSRIQLEHVIQRTRRLELNAALAQHGRNATQDRRRVKNRRRDVELPALIQIALVAGPVIPPDRIFID